MRFVVVLVLMISGRAARAEGPLPAGCKEVRTDPGQRKIACARASGSISAEQPASAGAAVIELLAKRLGADVDMQVDKRDVVVAGAPRRGLRWTDAGAKRPTVGVVAAVPSRAEHVRVIGCEAALVADCDALLPLLAELAKTPGPTEVAAAAATFAGRALKLEPGCTYGLDGPKHLVHCAGANVSWIDPTDEPDGVDWIAPSVKQALAARGEVHDRARACVVDGVESQCRDYEVIAPDGSRLYSTIAAARVRGERVLVQCNIGPLQGTRGDTLARPCSAILRFK